MAGLVLVQLAVAVLIDEFGKEKNAAEVNPFKAHCMIRYCRLAARVAIACVVLLSPFYLIDSKFTSFQMDTLSHNF
jgi:hypothetical protein